MASSKSEQLLKDDEPMMDISSLIDVCFLLLIFFLVTSTILPTERDLMLKLPDGRGVPSEDVVINLSVDAQGQIKMKSGGVEEVIDSDSNNRNLPKLVDRLQLFKMAAGPNDVVAMIDVDDAASQQRFIDVMNCLAGEEVTKVAFTARD